MKKYILISKNTPAQIHFTFDLNGVLREFKVNDATNELQVNWLAKKMPSNIDELKELNANEPKFNLLVGVEDISFDNFWNTYNYKVGSKPKAQALWKQMNDDEKVLAITYIKKYLNQIRLSGAAQAYPTTYLNQRYFES